MAANSDVASSHKCKCGMKRKLLVAAGNGSPSNKDVQFVRNFEHVEGNWPSHVYLDGSYRHIQGISDACKLSAKNLHGQNREVVPVEDPHLSVSRPFVLRKHQIIPFVTRLWSLVDHLHALAVRVPAQYTLLANDNNTRYFVALPVIDHSGKLLELVVLVDEALAIFSQPRYYERPIFHISVASMLPGPDSAVPDPTELHAVTVNPSVTSAGVNDSEDDSSDWLQLVGQVKPHPPAAAEPSSSSEERRVVAAPDSGAKAPGGTGVGLNSNNSPEVDKQSGVLGLLDEYSSDEEDSPEPVNLEKHADRVGDSLGCSGKNSGSSTQNGGKYSVVVNLTAVVCKIGNRIFRKELRPLNSHNPVQDRASTGLSGGTGNYGGFVECSS